MIHLIFDCTHVIVLHVDGYPPTINSYPECNKVVSDAATPFVGADRAAKPQKTMGAEDFSYFLQQRPGCFFFVGAGLPGPQRPHHKSVFDFDEVSSLRCNHSLVIH